MGIHIGMDTGGTFTDMVARDPVSGSVSVAKALSVPGATHLSVAAALEKAGLTDNDIEYFVHGTTIATNALIERKISRCAFVTTKGFGDLLHIQRLTRPRAYDLGWRKPKPLVARRDCYEVEERLDACGNVLIELDEDSVLTLANRIVASGAEAVSVGLLFSYLNPGHENSVKRIIHSVSPGMAVSVSHDVFGQWREYERFSTTAIDASIRRIVSQYARNMAAFAAERRVRQFFIMRSNGGVMTPDMTIDRPVTLVRSGPAAGVIAACMIGKLVGEPNLLTADMGGTSFDTCLIADYQAALTTQAELEWSIPIAVPMVDVRSVGAGGGSIGWLDLAGNLKVGPQSAGSEPGPACYGRGGVLPTVTDANLVLGRLDPAFPLAGDLRLDREASLRAIGSLASQLGREPLEVAAGMTDIVDNQMAQALRLVSVDRGHDPRRFSIMAFGGAGPLAAANLARLLGCKRVIVPIFPGAFSALGCLIAEPRFDYRRTRIMRSDAIDPDVVEAVFADLAAQGRHDFAREGNPEPPLIARSVEMRYAGQNWELEVPIDDQKPMAQAINDATACFEAAHKKRFGWHMEGSAFELVHFKASATSPRGKFELPKLEKGKMPKPASFRSVVFPGRPGWVEAAVYRRQDLPADGRIDGPAVIRELASTTLVPPGAHVDLDVYGNMIMTIG